MSKKEMLTKTGFEVGLGVLGIGISLLGHWITGKIIERKKMMAPEKVLVGELTVEEFRYLLMWGSIDESEIQRMQEEEIDED